ncbi:efflux RND transporter permease subunit [Shimazuella sp. AN120528]|uniref:efflux RND transporter permease subunit n=1 Tax=Shimazuella soli TaxID=1892854 RepID=UPI001F107085|nr:efflux RND transporter permease subunit [Shimazuella soli]MCH5586612.1 efflux RND transporter permease subunit [Shimazuella soli]
MIKQVVHIAGNELEMDLIEYMDFLVEEVIPKILQLPGVIKADVTKLTQMTITPDAKQLESQNVSLQAQVYYENEEAYQYVISNVIDEDLMQILLDGTNFISLYSGYQYSFQKY